MASSTTHLGSLPLMPPEILVQICKSLDQADLKTFRHACKHFSYAAEISLFRRVLLKRNVESFLKLRLIAGHPRISKLVKALCYSGKMFLNAYRCKNIDQWCKKYIGHCSEPPLADAIREYFKGLAPEDRQVHYQNFCAHRHSEQLMQQYDTETQNLVSIIAKLPQLEKVCFACDEECASLSDGPVSFDNLGSIARETLVEPTLWGGLDFHAGQFIALLEAVHTVQKPLNAVKALGVPWSVFQQSKVVSAMMVSAVNACQELRIEFRNGVDRENGRANLAKMISSSPSLQILEISFEYAQFRNRSWVIKFSELFGAGAHWPNLERLKLRTVKAAQTSLINLLTTHAASLRSLELADINLERYRLDEKEYCGSWVDIIIFMQHSMSLETVRLGGYLSNGLDEVWCLHDPDESDYWHDVGTRPEEGSCLKHRIERYIVEGGTCPLPSPHDAKESGGWNCIDFDGDSSWQFFQST